FGGRGPGGGSRAGGSLPESPFQPSLFGISAGRGRQRHKADRFFPGGGNGREEALDDEVDLPGPKSDDPEQLAAAAQLSARIRSALMRMSTSDRMVLTLRHFSECSYQEIGQILDLDEKRVKSRLYEARQQLRGMLKDLRPD